ncbi:MAG: hypothetical protein HXX17_08585 [Geobacteraceae bacterium]|nr:hypothetical protein [Geobacteraceae bacterium]
MNSKIRNFNKQQNQSKEKKMNITPSRFPFRKTMLTALALSALLATGTERADAAPLNQAAANATILNRITVTYKDTANASYSQTASATVTVLLQKAALNVTTLSDLTVNAGSAALYQYYSLTSTANGTDNYQITPTFSAASNLSAQTLDYAVYRYNGTAMAATNTGTQITTATGTNTLSNVAIGSTIGIAWDGTSKISVPFGSLNGITTNTLLMINGKGPFVVTGTSTGTAPANPGAETTPATITIAAFAGLTGVSAGPALTTLSSSDIVGQTIAERVYLQVTVNGTITASGTGTGNGTIIDTIGTKDSAGTSPSTNLTNTTTFKGTQLTISKKVANCTSTGASCGTYAATATALPGEILQYQVTVQNLGAGDASVVSIGDAIPNYTSMVAVGTTTLLAADTDNFATINANNIQVGGTGTAGVGYGKLTYGANPRSQAGNAFNFYLGTGSAVGTGGTLTGGGSVYTIIYRVKVN